jgi:hypothetical protein
VKSARTAAVLALCIALALAACTTSAPFEPVEAAAPPPSGVEVGRLEKLASDFYHRLENRRFNSIATFQDPGLREFFRSDESFSDYYAELAHALEIANFEASRPTSVELGELVQDAALRVRIRVRFVGENGLPLRWWTTTLDREDVWELGTEGRWWIVPGKV